MSKENQLESVSTLNFGTPLVQQNEVFTLKGLAAKAKQLLDTKNSVNNVDSSTTENKDKELKLGINTIENKYYKIDISLNGQINVTDKSSGILYEKICFFVYCHQKS